MIRSAKKLVRSNFSFLILGVSTISFFLLNVLLKIQLPAKDYGEVALLLTYISLLSSFGLFGSEQLFIRKSKINSNRNSVLISKSILWILVTSIILQIIFPLFYHANYGFSNFYSGVLISMLVVLNMLSYNVFRVIGKLNISQLNNALWKITLLILTAIVTSLPKLNNAFTIEILILSSLLFLGTPFVFLSFKNIVLFSKKKERYFAREDLTLVFFFFISLLTASFISQGERFLLYEITKDISFIGEYIFLSTVLVFPYNFLQNYLGFKYLNEFKTSSFPQELLTKKFKEVTVIALLFSPIILVGFLLIVYLGIINERFASENIIVVVILVLIGITRMYYSVPSSLMGARGSMKKIRSSNIYSLVSILIGVVLFFLFPNLTNLVLIFLLLWLARLIIWFTATRKDNYEDTL